MIKFSKAVKISTPFSFFKIINSKNIFTSSVKFENGVTQINPDTSSFKRRISIKMKHIFSLIILAMILFLITLGEFDNGVVATQDWPDPPFSTPSHQPPFIEILNLSEHQIVNSNTLNVRFTVTKPSSWISGPTMTWITPGYICWGKINYISYTLDGIQSDMISANDPTELGLRVYSSPPSRVMDFSLNLTGLSDGVHSIRVSAEAECLYCEGHAWLSNFVIGNSSEVTFIVDTGPPIITLVSPISKEYNTTDVSLCYLVSEPSEVTYSLDGLANVTLLGNITLSDLTVGEHSLTVFALDVAGNVAFDSIEFSVAESESHVFSLPLIIAISCVLLVIGCFSVVFFLRRKRRYTQTASYFFMCR